mmetsp:Transcript_28555/g.60584  ORF Transcript_28555/g.60584 Transcript_28555/m.60584 type:complete len:99 (-) Transcript_28555:1005-1301(-)
MGCLVGLPAAEDVAPGPALVAEDAGRLVGLPAEGVALGPALMAEDAEHPVGLPAGDVALGPAWAAEDAGPEGAAAGRDAGERRVHRGRCQHCRGWQSP